MAIINVTPDSFADGGKYPSVSDATSAIGRAVRAGADIIDIGGESTRPGAARVAAAEQIRRVTPVIEALRASGSTVPVSVDTTRAEVAMAALKAGADAVNDVSAGLEDPRLLDVVKEFGAGLVLMHRLRPPEGDSYSDRYAQAPTYGDVVRDVTTFLRDRAAAAMDHGIEHDRIVIDPGLGFGKTVEQNLELIRRTREVASLGFPVLSALSRKSFVGRHALGRDSTPDERLPGTLALSLEHLAAGASIFRVHDVAEHAEALRNQRRGATT
jgi:dihydropteroate synthase